MIEFLDMDSNKLVISEFIQNDKDGKYNYETVYQREKVWSEEKKSFLIDTILKNFPIPPIFLRMKIEPDTGVTKYEVIDGKQRLSSIKEFVDGDVLLPEDFSGDGIGNEALNGASFADLSREPFEKYKKQFWHYRIPVIFIETDDEALVKSVFDRLNRNGEPLVPQELRHAKYGDKKIYRLIDKLAKDHIWKDIFEKSLEIDRMEDKEFISELLFFLLEKKIISYTKISLDELYDKWANIEESNIMPEYNKLVSYLDDLNLDYFGLKIAKVSHLYAIWIIGSLACNQGIDASELGKKLTAFYSDYMLKKDIIGADEYRKSMSSNTKSVGSRNKRISALISYLNSQSLNICKDFS